MSALSYQSGEAYFEGVALTRLAAEVGTPAYVYSCASLKDAARSLKRAFADYPTLPCYAVKANGNLCVLGEIFSEGFGADVVSAGEMERALAGGAKAGQIVFSGVGKTNEEMALALKRGILCFNAESLEELERLASVASQMNGVAPVSLRVNPNIDAKTNPYIATGLYSTKFGIVEGDLPEALAKVRSLKHLKLVGLDCHIGSQITEIGPFKEAAERMATLSKNVMAQGFKLEAIDLGGGLGIRYDDETPPSIEQYARTLIEAVRPTGLKLLLEPGRWLVGNAGILLTRVIGTKRTPLKPFLIVDAAMNDLARPALYEAFHNIVPVKENAWTDEKGDVVGPVCESGDFLAKDRRLPSAKAGDLLVVESCGAYASSMASRYNCRPLSPEVLVNGSTYRLVRPRETVESQWESEKRCL